MCQDVTYYSCRTKTPQGNILLDYNPECAIQPRKTSVWAGLRQFSLISRFLFFCRSTIYIFFFRSSSPLLAILSSSFHILHVFSLHSSFVCPLAFLRVFHNHENINRPPLFLYLRTVFPDCKLFTTYLHMHPLRKLLSTQANTCVLSQCEFFGYSKSH